MSRLSICIHKPGTKSLDLNEVVKICEQSGQILSLIPTPVLIFINFKRISNIVGCIRKLQKAGYSAEESRKNRKMRARYGIVEEAEAAANAQCTDSEDEKEETQSGSDSGQGSIVESPIGGQCNNPSCSKHTSSVCGRCRDFFCSQECLHKEWDTHRFICFPIPKVKPIERSEDDIFEDSPSSKSPPSVSTSFKKLSIRSSNLNLDASTDLPLASYRYNKQKSFNDMSEISKRDQITKEESTYFFNKYFGFKNIARVKIAADTSE